MQNSLLLVASTFLLSACVNAQARLPTETVTVEVYPGGWGGKHYTLEVQKSGQVTYVGLNGDLAVHGERKFEAPQSEVTTSFALLEQYRPVGKRALVPGEECKELWTDMAGVSVVWTTSTEEQDTLDWYAGCDAETHKQLGEDIFGAYKAITASLPLIEKSQ